jgi:hypothetical protein
MNLDDLSDIIKQAKTLVAEKMSELTEAEKKQVDDIVKGVDLKDAEAIKNKIDELNKNKDAKD